MDSGKEVSHSLIEYVDNPSGSFIHVTMTRKKQRQNQPDRNSSD